MKSFFDGESIWTLERRAAVDADHGGKDTSFIGDEDVDAVGRFVLRANNAGSWVADEVNVVCGLVSIGDDRATLDRCTTDLIADAVQGTHVVDDSS